MAVGHSILVAAYHILRDHVPSRDLGPDHFDRLAIERLTRHYVHRLEQLGHRVPSTRPHRGTLSGEITVQAELGG